MWMWLWREMASLWSCFSGLWVIAPSVSSEGKALTLLTNADKMPVLQSTFCLLFGMTKSTIPYMLWMHLAIKNQKRIRFLITFIFFTVHRTRFFDISIFIFRIKNPEILNSMLVSVFSRSFAVLETNVLMLKVYTALNVHAGQPWYSTRRTVMLSWDYQPT